MGHNEHQIYIRNIRDLKIVNMVASTRLTENLDLNLLFKNLKDVMYNPKKYKALIYNTKTGGLRILVNNSGKLIFVGAKNLNQIDKIFNKFIKDLDDIGIKIIKSELKIQNIVATFSFLNPIDIDVILKILPQNDIEYEPEQFPGAIYRIGKSFNNNITILLFKSGKCVIVGAKSHENINKSIELLSKKISYALN